MSVMWIIGACLLAFLTLWTFLVAAVNATSRIEWVVLAVLFTAMVALLAYSLTGGV